MSEQLGLDGEPTPLPMLTDEDRILNAVILLWQEGESLQDQATEMDDEARNLRYMADEKLDEASELARSIVEAHPEWKDLLDMGKDPRHRGWD